VSSTAIELVSVSGKDGGRRGRKGTPNHGSEGRALEATVPAKAVLGATAEAIQAVREATDPVRVLAEAVGASAVGRLKFKLQTSNFKVVGCLTSQGS
jgi:hypothetical protein